MSPRRRLRANREKWRADQTGRNIRLKIATHLAAVLVIHGNCAKPETGWSEAERLFTKADSAESAARASAPALLFCEGCPARQERAFGTPNGRPDHVLGDFGSVSSTVRPSGSRMTKDQ